ncbi:MAG: hypothetical protein A3G08_03840 [Candidatus Magasanikbacteria bacterium RIFCSPLOWO2_12_FULL_47_9b]|nr:MAG: hypothetical protein A3G08_03840 [Candidatus Magasanikbacteria bacterium RIFCSPLOWO2_12_FULL_47_9b]
MAFPWKKLFIRKECDLPTFGAAIQTAYHILWRFTKLKKEYLFAHLKGRDIYYYIHDVDERAVGRSLYQKKYSTPLHIQERYAEGVAFLKQTKITARYWQKSLAKNFSRDHLSRAFAAFQKDFAIINNEYSILPWWALESWQYDFLETTHALIQKKKAEAYQDTILASLLRPWKRTAVQDIERKFHKGVPVSRLVHDYQFLRSCTVVWHTPITAEWIEDVCKKVALPRQDAFSQKKIIQLLRPNTQEKRYIEAAPYVVFFKDWRDDVRRKHAFLWTFLFDGLSRYFDVAYDDIGYSPLWEIDTALKKDRIDRQSIQERKQYGCVLTSAPRALDIRVIERPRYERYVKRALAVDMAWTSMEIHGIIAQRGVARGRVRVVRKYADVFHIKGGDILVANTTHPNYLVGMKKAAAFITDEGGIASHAAIVAREMKKPCLVGTGNATKALRDGDMVEVDAERGTVCTIQ